MIASILIEGFIIGIIVSIPLGPIGVLCIQRTLLQGRRSGFVSGIGAATADSSFAFIAGFGLSFIAKFFEEQHFYIMLAGASVLIFLGFRLFFTNTIRQVRKYKINKSNPFSDFFSVFALTLSNPVTILFFGLVFTSLGLVKHSIIHTLTIVGGVFLGACTWWFILCSLVSVFRNLFKLRVIFWINKAAGVLIVLFGIFAFINAFYPINTEQVEKQIKILHKTNKTAIQ
ncbi:MAG: LysE family translocator [Bacteroidales bacterium]|jgi:threonine/homoserine/homoserine lactone efflux protein|nr:LysE family translocator [Bacteroidales bacterium]